MKRLTAASLVILAAALLAAADVPKVTRAMVESMERSFDVRLIKLNPDDPFALLGATRGFYLDGLGVVFSAEVNLATGTAVTPFHQAMSREEIARHRQKKLARIPMLKQAMREMMVASAASLDTLPQDNQVIVEVTVSRYSWEDTAGIPAQILMQASKRKLLEAQRANSGLEAAIRVQEF